MEILLFLKNYTVSLKSKQLAIIPIVLAVIGVMFAFTIPGTFQCQGDAACFSGKVTAIVDGDTIKVDGESIRFALASSPEEYEEGGKTATLFLENTCPVGSTVLVDEDDGQQEGSYGRMIGVVYCNGQNLNQALLDSDNGYLSTEFCDISEFGTTEWAHLYGC